MRTIATVFVSLVTALAGFAQAQDLPVRVGRVAHIEGQASLFQDPDEGWERAYVNSPITSENSLWTDNNSRAEMRVSGIAMRLDEQTQLDIARLEETQLEAFIARGSVSVRVRHFQKDDRMVLNTLNARVRIRGDGRYRVDFDPDRMETRVSVFAGEVRIGTDDGRMRVAAGRSVIIFGVDRPEFFEETARTDGFDRWNVARDGLWRESRAVTYVGTYMTGYEDLDSYGDWATEPDYGTLWYPRGVAANWAPYRHGRWDYVRPWGWTWIDDSPWGYAPFHYGRWVYVRNRWAWHPGQREARPVYAPALVAWIGGSNFNVRVASGGPAVGWYPLSPWDRYDPWFNASPTYLNRVNVVVRRDEPRRDDRRQWREWTRERGTTVVDRSVMVDRRPVAAAAMPVAIEAIRQARAVERPESVLPSRNDVIARRRQQPQQAAPAPTAPAVAQQQGQPAQPGAAQQPPGRSAIVRPDFGRRATAAATATPERSSAPPAQRPATAPGATREAQREQERATREAQQAQERAAREAQRGQQQQTQQQQQAAERAQREAQQAQERAQREGQQAQERAQREAQQAADKQQREAQQAQQRGQQQQQQQAQERAQREAQQAQERAAREAQKGQQQQQQAQERAQREAQQAAEKQQREAQQAQQRGQQQQQQQAQERAQREAQQAAEKQQREAQQAQQRAQQQQQQQQQQAQERAQREAQQAAEKQQREAQQAQQRAQQQQQQQQQQQAQQRAQREAQQAAEKQQREAQQAQQRAQQQQQQQQQQAAERAQREAQQAQERAAREAQRAQQPQQQQAQPPAAPAQAPAPAPQRERGKGRDKDDDEEKEKGKGRNK